jgi:putative heme-binding domain-containing protein
LVTANAVDQALSQAGLSDDSQLAFLNSIEWIPDVKNRGPLREHVVAALKSSQNDAVRRAAIRALGSIPERQTATFELLASWFPAEAFRPATVRALLKVPVDKRTGETGAKLARSLVDYAEQTPAEQRTSSSFIDAMQLADQLLAKLPSEEAKVLRKRLDAVTVRVIRIRTVEEEMRYDLPYFAVQAGKSVQVVLENHDLMPHNLVITVPGALKEVAQLGLQVGPQGGWKGLAYVPESDKVLHATNLVPADQQARLTFEAPTEPGEYPYVCTFPQHWYRMYGVMVVVEDLDAWLKNPVEPANPIGSNRSFVQAWTLNDLKEELDAGLRGRTLEIGQRIFQEASCAGCHKINGEGGIIGPELTEVISRWKGDRLGVLREILEPSHKVDDQYLMQKILTVDGQTITGIRIAEDDKKVTLVSSPDAKEPMILLKDDIEAMVPSSVSMMPKALLDQYTKDEIFELLAYLESVNPKSP